MMVPKPTESEGKRIDDWLACSSNDDEGEEFEPDALDSVPEESEEESH